MKSNLLFGNINKNGEISPDEAQMFLRPTSDILLGRTEDLLCLSMYSDVLVLYLILLPRTLGVKKWTPKVPPLYFEAIRVTDKVVQGCLVILVSLFEV